MQSDKLLILDLDETLIHASKTGIADLKADYSFDTYSIYKRPHLDVFLDEISRHYTLGIWSTGGEEYVKAIVDLIRPPQVDFLVVWNERKCTLRKDFATDNYYYEKRLHKLRSRGFGMEKILLVDDTAEKCRYNYGNAIYISPYYGDPADSELMLLLPFLISLKNVDNVRNVEKRFWRSTVKASGSKKV